MPLDFNEIRQLLVTINQIDIAEITLKSDDFELTVRKTIDFSNQMLPGAASIQGAVTRSTPLTDTQAGIGTEAMPRVVDKSFDTMQPLVTTTPIDQKLVDVTSPMVGTFYRSPAPGEPSFTDIGDRIKLGQTLCIIEAMKLMNEIEAEVSGQVVEILVQNGEPVEYGQPLMRINPD